jgi:hypothetical protein
MAMTAAATVMSSCYLQRLWLSLWHAELLRRWLLLGPVSAVLSFLLVALTEDVGSGLQGSCKLICAAGLESE